jgi:hypothetical protein
VDVAPTIAALLGVAIPASNQGRPLLDFLAVAPGDREAIVQALYEQRSRFVKHYVGFVSGPRSADGHAGGPAAAPPETGLLALAQAAERAKQERMAADARPRLVVLLAVAAVIVGAGLALRAAAFGPPGGFALAVLAGLGAAVVYFLLFRAAGLQYSFSAVNRDEALGRFFLTDMVLAVTSCALVTAFAAGWLARRLGRLPLLDLARLSFLVTAVFCALLVLKMAVAYWRHGIFLRWQMPDQFWAFGFYLDTLAVVALGTAAPLLPLAAWAGGALGRGGPRAALPRVAEG